MATQQVNADRGKKQLSSLVPVEDYDKFKADASEYVGFRDQWAAVTAAMRMFCAAPEGKRKAMIGQVLREDLDRKLLG